MHLFKSVFTTAVLAGAALPCLGQGSIYFDRGAFDLAISGVSGIRTDVNFEPPLPPGGILGVPGVQYFSPLTMSGLTFRGGGPLIIRLVSFNPDYNRVLNNYDSLTPLTVDMNGPTLAFGADFASLLNPFYSSFLATVTLDTGNVFTFTAPADPNFTFFGFVTPQPFSTLTFSDGGLILAGLHEEILANITVVQVPEPGAWGLLALGAMLLGWRWRGAGKS